MTELERDIAIARRLVHADLAAGRDAQARRMITYLSELYDELDAS